MEISFQTKNMELTNHLKEYGREKLSKVDKFLKPLLEKQAEDEEKEGKDLQARVDLEIEFEKITKQKKGDVHRVEAQMYLPGGSIRAEETTSSPKEAIAEVSNELQRQVKEYKEKQSTLQRKGEREAKKMREKADEEEL